MNQKSEIRSFLSMRAIASKARVAAVSAAIARNSKRKKEDDSHCKSRKAQRPKKADTRPEIDREIDSIVSALTSSVSESNVVEVERTAEGTACKARVSIYKRDERVQQRIEEAAYREALSRGVDRRNLTKPFRAKPTVMYAFYPFATDSTRLGSVAVYGNDASVCQSAIAKRGHLFGHIIASATVEVSIRPFVDVKFKR
ncbi:MAG: hypothetical protein NC339_02360 [Muribaculaceae bacterium]|nr:hypothetical protein [Muribaculaceae bacterium]